MADDKLLIVVKLGSQYVSGGISGNDAPTARSLNLIEADETTITDNDTKGPKKYRNPVKDGVLTDPKDFELLIKAVVGNDFDAPKESSGILICDMPRHTTKERAMMCEVLFDVLEFPYVNFFYRPALAAMSAGQVHALVVELSDNGVVIAPVIETQMLKDKTIINNTLAGSRLTNDLLLPAIAKANNGTKVVEKFSNNDKCGLKRWCKVAPTAAAYDAIAKDPKANEASKETWVLNPFVKDETGKQWQEFVYPTEADLASVPEALFRPSLLPGEKSTTPSLTDLVVEALENSDIALAGMIVLTGRGCMFPGFKERFEHEVSTKLAAKSLPATVAVIEDEARAQGAWVGGSLLTSMRSIQDNNFVSKDTWTQYGSALFESGWLSQ